MLLIKIGFESDMILKHFDFTSTSSNESKNLPYPEKLADWFVSASNYYLVVDAARCGQIIGQDDISELAEEHRCQSLFRKMDLAHVSPWLIDLGSVESANNHSLIQLFFLKLWGQRAGMLLRTDASFDRLFSHLRTFIMAGDREAQTETDVEPPKRFFRYWDPLVAGVYFPGILERPERVEQLLKTADGHVVEMLIEDGPEHATALTATQNAKNNVGQLVARKPLMLDAQDKRLMDEISFRALGLELSKWFVDAFPNGAGALPDSDREKAAHHVVTTGRAIGLQLKEDYSYLAHVMAHFGGWFFEVSATPILTNALFDKSAHHRHCALEEAFPKAWDDSLQAALSKNWSDIYERVSNMPQKEWISPGFFKSLSDDCFSDKMDALTAIVAGARPAAQAAKYSVNKEGQHIFLSILFGHRYQEDPFRPWAKLPFEDALDAAWQTAFKNQIEGV